MELSDSTFAASARLIGAATLALINDICSRSGNASPTCDSTSSFESALDCVSSRVGFVICDLLLVLLSCLRLVRLSTVPLNNRAVGVDTAARNAAFPGGDCGVDIGHDVDSALPVTDELVYDFVHCPPSFYVIGSITCQPSGFATWLQVTEREGARNPTGGIGNGDNDEHGPEFGRDWEPTREGPPEVDGMDQGRRPGHGYPVRRPVGRVGEAATRRAAQRGSRNGPFRKRKGRRNQCPDGVALQPAGARTGRQGPGLGGAAHQSLFDPLQELRRGSPGLKDQHAGPAGGSGSAASPWWIDGEAPGVAGETPADRLPDRRAGRTAWPERRRPGSERHSLRLYTGGDRTAERRYG